MAQNLAQRFGGYLHCVKILVSCIQSFFNLSAKELKIWTFATISTE